MKVGDQLVYLARLHGMDRTAAQRSMRRWTENLGVEARRGDEVIRLSLGNQQRVQLAAALVHDPQILVLDEPFSGLDPVAVDVMSDVLRAQARVPVMFSSHQLELVERLADRVGIVKDGSMVAVGTIDELRRTEQQQLLVDGPPPTEWVSRVPAARVVTPDIDGHGLRPPDERCAGHERDQRKQHRADRIGVHDRVQRDAAEQSRRRVAKAVGGERMGHLVHGQREQQDNEGDEDQREVDVRQTVKVTADSRKRQGRHRPLSRPTDRRQFLARGATDARQTAKLRQQRFSPARADAGHIVELRAKVAKRSRLAVKRDRKAMRLVANALDQQQRRIVRRERDRVLAIAREQQLFLLRDPDRDQVGQSQRLERRVGGGELSFAAVDQNQIRKRTALLEQLAIAAQDDLAASRRSRRGSGLGLGRCRSCSTDAWLPPDP